MHFVCATLAVIMSLRERFDTLVKAFMLFTMLAIAAVSSWVAPPRSMPPTIHGNHLQKVGEFTNANECIRFVSPSLIYVESPETLGGKVLQARDKANVPVTVSIALVTSSGVRSHSVTIIV